MKLSRWNTYISLDERTGLIYNSYTDSYIAIRDSLRDFEIVRKGTIELLSDSFKEKLIGIGALVDSDCDEIRALSDLISKIDEDSSFFQIIINPTLDCNFNCWYCYENHIKDSYMTSDMVNAIETYIKKLFLSNIEWFGLSFFGGEPFIEFERIIKPLIIFTDGICCDKCVDLHLQFTTNGYLLDENIIEFLSKYDSSFQITLDGGKNEHDKTRFTSKGGESFYSILNNVKMLSLFGNKVTLRINFTKKTLDSTCEIINIIKEWPSECKNNIVIDYQQVWQDKADGVYEEIRNKLTYFRSCLNRIGYRTANNRIFNYVTDSCYADKKNEVLINYNGDIFACTARDFKKENRLGFLSLNGEIIWDKDKLEHRRSCKFSKKICHECSIAPICGGGCRTRCIETSDVNSCNLGYTREDIENLILERFEDRFMKDYL